MRLVAFLRRRRRLLRRAAIALAAAIAVPPLALVDRRARRVVPARAPRAAPRRLADRARRGRERVAPGRDVRGWTRDLGAAGGDLRAPASTRRSPVEDRRFWKHAGVDPVGVLRAGWLDVLRGPRGLRRLDPHHAVGPTARPAPEDAAGKGPRSRRRRAHRARAVEAGDPRAILEPRLLRQRRVGSRGGGALLLRQARGGAVAGRGRLPGCPAPGPGGLRSVPPLRAGDRPAPPHPRPDAGRGVDNAGGPRRRRADAAGLPARASRAACAALRRARAGAARSGRTGGRDRRDDAGQPAAAAAGDRGA